MANGIQWRALAAGAALCGFLAMAAGSVHAQASAVVNICGQSVGFKVVAHGNWTGENNPPDKGGGPADEKIIVDSDGNNWGVDSHGEVIGPAKHSTKNDPNPAGHWDVTPNPPGGKMPSSQTAGGGAPCPPPKLVPMQPSGPQG